jgi:hypothetical protein
LLHHARKRSFIRIAPEPEHILACRAALTKVPHQASQKNLVLSSC